MNTFPLLVGFAFAIGVGLMANTVFNTLFDFGRRLSRGLSRNAGRLVRLGIDQCCYRKLPRIQKMIFWGWL